MPEFIPEHTPANLDAFTRGYLDCAEWLLDEETAREDITEWHETAIARAVEDCADFQESNAELLIEYGTECNRDDYCAGMDFYLSRNGHGAGYFDRGNAPCFNKLQNAARIYSSAEPYLGDDGCLYFY